MTTWIVFGLDDLYLNDYGIDIRTAHAVLLSITVLILRPLGAIFVRRAAQWSARSHIALQTIGIVIGGAGVGLGIWLANYMERFGTQHVIIGFVTIFLIAIQIILGIAHYRKAPIPEKRTGFGLAHTILGRLIILLGIANGIIGLLDSGNTLAAIIIYSIAAFVSLALYVLAAILPGARRRREKGSKLKSKPFHNLPFSGYERFKSGKNDVDVDVEEVPLGNAGYGKAKLARDDASMEEMPLAGDVADNAHHVGIAVQDYSVPGDEFDARM